MHLPWRYRLATMILVLGCTALAARAPAPTVPDANDPEPGLADGQAWIATWAASAHGPYPIGNPTAQPELKFAIAAPETGLNDQSLREIVRPDLWGKTMRLRFTNVFGDKPVTIDGAHVGLQLSGAEIVHGTNIPALFQGKDSITIPPGQWAHSDPVTLGFVDDPANPLLAGRKLAVSFHVAGESGKLTWHAKGLTTSYLGPPGGGAHGAEESEAAYLFSTTSWFLLDDVEVAAPTDTVLIAAFGDSITDGTASTINGDDRWPDVLSRRLHAAFGTKVAIVNEGIGGNQLVGPKDYAAAPIPGGPSALSRLDRDVFGLPGLKEIIWLEGINDYNAGADPQAVIDGMKELVRQAHERKLRIIGGTLTSALHASLPVPTQHGTDAVDAKRKAQNDFIRNSSLFDAVVDFDAVTRDPTTGELQAEFQPGSSVGGPGDRLHPNRAGYLAMGAAVDLGQLLPLKQASGN